MHRLKYILLILLAVSACAQSDSGSDDDANTDTPIQTNRLLGISTWPYEATNDALDRLYALIKQHAGMIDEHLQSGVPWTEALAGTAYSSDLVNDIQQRKERGGSSRKIYLSIDSLDSSRRGLANYWGSSKNLALPAAFRTKRFNDPEVADAYIQFASDMIDEFSPSYFNYGAEVSELAINDLAKYEDFLVFAERVYATLKARYPQVTFLISIAAKHPDSSEAEHIRTHLPRLMPFVDMLGISAYPYLFFGHANPTDPDNLPPNWLSQFSEISGSKRMAVTETSWIAEDLIEPAYHLTLPSSAAFQKRYVELLLAQAANLDLAFVNWFVMVDYDALWTNNLGKDPLAHLWKDSGLIDENLNARPALEVWRNFPG